MADDIAPVQPGSSGLDQDPTDQGDDLEVWVTIKEAVEATGITDKTLRRWLKAGTVQGRSVSSSTGDQWTVELSRVKEVALQRAIGVFADIPVEATETTPVQPGQMLVPKDQWEKAVAQMANIVDLAGEIGEAKEAKGRAEATAEQYKQRISDAREAVQRERDRADRAEAELKQAREEANKKRGWFRR